MKKIYYSGFVITVLFMLVFTNTWAQTTCTTLKAGNWNDPTTWDCGSAPSEGFSGTINILHTVSIINQAVVSITGQVSVNVSGEGSINFGTGQSRGGQLLLPNRYSIINLSTAANTIDGGNNNTSFQLGFMICDGPYNGSQQRKGSVTYSEFSGCSGNALPVTLLSFTAKPEGDRVQLAWSTTSERDADYFVVERSANLIEYVTVGKVAAKGTTVSRQNYGLTDENPLLGNNYYRLRQIDHNGTLHQFKPVAAVVSVDEVVAVVYPNPSHGARIHLRLWNADDATVRLLSLAGQLIDSRLELGSGEADLIPQHPLPTGIYLVEVQTQGQKRVSKVIVR